MKIQALYDLQQEINRLFIAGSKFAKNDPRLSKHLPILNKLGEKSPVFKKLASEVEQLSLTDVNESANKLLGISTLLYSILYTQGDDTLSDAVAEQKASISLDELHTQASYAQLKPVIKALSEANQGRLNVVTDAFEQGVFADFRTHQYLDGALGDKYGELCNLIEDKIIPSIGAPMIPFLLRNLNYDGTTESKTADVRRVRLLIALNYSEVAPIVKTIMEGNNANLQAAAINFLAKDIAQQDYVLQLAEDKQKVVREAAFKALVNFGSEKAFDKLTKLLVSGKKSDKESLAATIGSAPIPYFADRIYDQLRICRDAFLAYDYLTIDKKTLGADLTVPVPDKEIAATFDQFATMAQSISNDCSAEALEFVENLLLNNQYHQIILAKKDILHWSATGVTAGFCRLLSSMNNPKALALLKEMAELVHSRFAKYNWLRDVCSQYFSAASKTLTKEQMFDEFAPYYKRNDISANVFFNLYFNQPIQEVEEENEDDRNEEYSYYAPYRRYTSVIKNSDLLDPRWSDMFLAKLAHSWGHNDTELILWLSILIEGHKSTRIQAVLSQVLRATQTDIPESFVFLTKLLIESGQEGIFDLIFETCERTAANTKKKRYGSYRLWQFVHSEVVYLFPVEYGAKFKEVYQTSKLAEYKIIAERVDPTLEF